MQGQRRNKAASSNNCYQALEMRRLLAGISFNGATGEVFIGGTSGDDVTSISMNGANVSASLTGYPTQTFPASSVTKFTFVGVDGDDRFTNNTSIPSFAFGNNGNDTLTGGPGGDVLNGGRGNDILAGRDGNDDLRGGPSPGLDVINAGNGDDVVFGSADDTEIFGGNGDDLIYGGNSDDMINAGAGNDQIFPGAGTNTIYAGNGDDFVVGGTDTDIVFGQGGSDRIYSLGGDDQLDGGSGNDFLFGGNGVDSLFGQGGIDYIRGGGGADTLNSGGGVTGAGRDVLFGDGGDDNITGLGFSDYIDGGVGNNTINAGGGVDVIFGRNGADTINAGPGNDLIIGGQGNDMIDGEQGIDYAQYEGQFSNYTLTGQGTLTVTDDVGNEGADLLTNVSKLRFSDGDFDAVAPPTAIERVTIRPIIVSNTNGSNTAEFFGTASQEADIKSTVDSIFAQAKIDIAWEAARTWNNTFANVGSGGGVRSTGDLATILSQGDSAGVGSSNSLVIDMYFVEKVPGSGNTGELTANGFAFVSASGVAFHVGDNLLGSGSNRDLVARVVAHEVSHNLGLSHISTNGNLMNPAVNGINLTQSQINTTISSNLSRPI